LACFVGASVVAMLSLTGEITLLWSLAVDDSLPSERGDSFSYPRRLPPVPCGD
jgi:hypothetical protein